MWGTYLNISSRVINSATELSIAYFKSSESTFKSGPSRALDILKVNSLDNYHTYQQIMSIKMASKNTLLYGPNDFCIS